MSLTKEGHSAIFSTKGNNDCHIILRGGKKPNYDAENIQLAAEQLQKYGLKPHVMVDFSHANSMKDFRRQIDVCNNVAEQINQGENRIMGVMLESHLIEGRQDVVAGQPLTYGQSITDACISWELTETCLRNLAAAVRARRDINAQQASA
jgi:3-deoxy-7-phosphoheptulonate synthase